MAEQDRDSGDEAFDQAVALEAARKAVAAIYAEGVRDEVESAFPPEIRAEAAVEETFTPDVVASAAMGALDDKAEQIRAATGQVSPPYSPYGVMAQASPQNANFLSGGVMSRGFGGGGAEHFQGVPTDRGGFAVMQQEYGQQFSQPPQQPPVGPATPGPLPPKTQ